VLMRDHQPMRRYAELRLEGLHAPIERDLTGPSISVISLLLNSNEL